LKYANFGLTENAAVENYLISLSRHASFNYAIYTIAAAATDVSLAQFEVKVSKPEH